MKASSLAISNPDVNTYTPRNCAPSSPPPSTASTTLLGVQHNVTHNVTHNGARQIVAESSPQDPLDVQLDFVHSVADQVSSTTQQSQFFELCVRGGTHRRCLREICISTTSSDGEFFNKVKNEYYRKFHRIRAISFSQLVYDTSG
jgi:hypothetical protein